MYCKQCGSYLEPDTLNCPVCGAPVPEQPASEPQPVQAELVQPQGASEQHSASWEFGAGVTGGGPSTPPPPSYGEPRYQRQAPPAPAPKAEDEPEQPVKTLEWLWSLILTAIPIVNLVVLLIWSFGGGTSITKRNWARAKLILVAVGTVIGVILCIALFGMIAYFTGFGYGGFGHGGYGYGFDTPFYYY